MNKTKYKVLHLPTSVGGNPQGLSAHLRKLGVDSESWAIRQNYFAYRADRFITNTNDSIILIQLKKIWALKYVFRYQVVFFNFGSTLFQPSPVLYDGKRLWFKHLRNFYNSLMQRLELGLLRILRRKVFIQYQGDDARQGDYCLSHFSITHAAQVDALYYTIQSDILKRKQIALLSHRCVKIFALNPDLLHVLPSSAEFLPYSHISLTDWHPCYNQLEKRPLRIGHAPSHRAVKGTDLVLAAVDALKREGWAFEFILIEGLSNADAKARYQSIDILVDQLFAGWYGGLAVEAMALGKPVIAYIRAEDLHFIPEQMRVDLPIIQAEPGTILKTLEDVLNMPRIELFKKAQQSRAFVEKWHDPMSIAARVKQDIESALELSH